MPHYFYLHTRQSFSQLVPALAQSLLATRWQPLHAVAAQLAAIPADSLLAQALQGAPFRRDLWHAVAGEFLVLAAHEVPRLEIDAASLLHLLTGQADADLPRADFSPIHQVLLGSRELRFGPAFYRPSQAGWNDGDDVLRLRSWLEAVDPAAWRPETLEGAPHLRTEQDRSEELDFLRDGWPALVDLYRRAERSACVVIGETS